MQTRKALALGLLTTVLALAASACSSAPLGPSHVELDSLHVSFDVTPASIAPGAPTTARVVLRNLQDEELQLSFGMSCPFYLTAYRRQGGRRSEVSLDGTAYGCLAVGSGTTIAPGDSIVYQRTVEARIGKDPAPAGEYVMRAEFTANLPGLETLLRIR